MPDLSDPAVMAADTRTAYLDWWAAAVPQSDGPASTITVVRAAETTEDAVKAMLAYSMGPFQAGILYALNRVADPANYPSGVGDD